MSEKASKKIEKFIAIELHDTFDKDASDEE